jgi:predicted nucleic acid-binding protein
LIVVDTSVLVDFLRGRDTEGARRFRDLESDGLPYSIPALCCQELLGGTRDQSEWQLLLDCLETQSILGPVDAWHTHVEAARIMVDCRAQGLTIRGAADCFIAQLVLENDGVLLHSDKDYERIASIRPLRFWD